MKYEVTFIHKNGKPQSDTTLIFGDRDAIDIAKKCFEYGKSNNYSDLEIRKVRDENKENKEESKTGHCKDCKWWKDSDGVYRRGVGAESQCPINCREVHEGNGYCFRFNPQESEE